MCRCNYRYYSGIPAAGRGYSCSAAQRELCHAAYPIRQTHHAELCQLPAVICCWMQSRCEAAKRRTARSAQLTLDTFLCLHFIPAAVLTFLLQPSKSKATLGGYKTIAAAALLPRCCRAAAVFFSSVRRPNFCFSLSLRMTDRPSVAYGEDKRWTRLQ